MAHTKRRLMYRNKLVIILLLTTVVPLTIYYAYFFINTYTARRNEILENTKGSLYSSAVILNNMYTVCEQQLSMIHKNYQIQKLLRSEQQVRMSLSVFDFYNNLNDLYYVLKDVNPSWKLTVYTMNPNVLQGAFIENIDRINPRLMEKITETEPDEYLWIYDYDPNQLQENLYMLKQNTSSSGEAVAIEQIRIGFERIRGCFSADFPSGTELLYYVGGITPVKINNKTGLSVAQAEELYESEDKNYYYVKAEITSNKDFIVALIPKSYVISQLKNSFIMLVVGYALLIIIFLLLTKIISIVLSQRLYRLIVEINQDLPNLMKNGNFSMSDGTDEFAKINRRFMELVVEIKNYYAKLTIIEAENKALELELLQSLINPHFLYNTLDGIKWTYRDPRLSEVIDAMVCYYRIALNRGNNILSVSQELEMVRSYLEIQKFAYEADFKYKIYVGDEIKNCLMLKNLIQPVVENALLHGIKRRAEDMISVSGKRDNDAIVFTVTDNGVGMPEDKAAKIMNGTYKGIKSSYGLYNVMRRIQLYCGDEYGVSVESSPGMGTEVTLRVKYVPNDVDKNVYFNIQK